MGSTVTGAPPRSGPFWRGVLAGAGAVLAALAMGIGYLTTAGITVTVAAGPLAEQVAAEVETAVRRELAAALADVQAQWPARVQEAARSRLSGLRLEVAGLTVELPEAVREQVERAAEQAAQSALEAAADRAQVDAVAARVGGRAAALARDHLPEALGGQRLVLQVAPGVAVPVRIRVQ